MRHSVYIDDYFAEIADIFSGFSNVKLNGVEKYQLNPKYEIEVLKAELENLEKQHDYFLRKGTETDLEIQEKEKRLKDLEKSK